MPPTYSLRTDSRLLPLGRGGVAIGRLAGCDLVLDGDDVSRRHARIVTTPEGPVLVDRSRFGTMINGEQVICPTLVHLGDVLRIGRHELRVEPWSGPDPALATHGWRERLRGWRARFGGPELAAIVAGQVAALAVLRATQVTLLAAIAGSCAEAIGFYGVLGWEEIRQARVAAGAVTRRPALPGLAVLRDLAQEFGAAEAADTLLLRPLAYFGGLSLIGGWPGILAGKLVADLLFYGPVLGLLHWKMVPRRTGFAAPRPARPTTAVRMPSISKD